MSANLKQSRLYKGFTTNGDACNVCFHPVQRVISRNVYPPQRWQLYCFATFVLIHSIVDKICRNGNSNSGSCTMWDVCVVTWQWRRRCMMFDEKRMVMTSVGSEKYDTCQAAFRDSVHLVPRWEMHILEDLPRTVTPTVAHNKWLSKKCNWMKTWNIIKLPLY